MVQNLSRSALESNPILESNLILDLDSSWNLVKWNKTTNDVDQEVKKLPKLDVGCHFIKITKRIKIRVPQKALKLNFFSYQTNQTKNILNDSKSIS